jgi:prophage DNA circulation protein
VPELQEEVIRAWEVVVAVEAACATVVRFAVASAQEVAAARQRVAFLIQEVEARATLAEREARERRSKVEAESVVALASARGEVEGFTWRVALREGELVDARYARFMDEVNFQGLLVWQPTPIDGERKLRGCAGNWSRSLPYNKPEDPSCATP